MSVAASQRSSKKQYKMAAKGTAISNAPENNSADQYVEYDIEEKPQVSNGSDEQTESSEQFFSWSQICRVCANPNDHIIPIFEAEGAEHDLINKIHKYLPIQVSKTDTLPLQLCYHCAATILAWHELLEGCLDAENQLLQMQIEQTEKQQLETKSGQYLNEEQIDDPDQAIMEQDEEEAMEHAGIGEEPTKRSDRAKATFKVFLEMAHNVCRRTRRSTILIKDEKPMEIQKTDDFSLTGISPNLQVSVDENPDRPIEKTSRQTSARTKKSKKSPVTKSDTQNEETTNRDDDTSPDEDDEKNTRVKCNICSREFSHIKELTEHVKEHKKKHSASKKPYKCNECFKIFRIKESYLRHLRIHRDERPFTCHVCGKQFRDSGSLSRHVRDVHEKLKKYSCDLCATSFSSKATRDDHRRIHTGERPYSCDSCNKTFKSRACLYTHSKLHTDEFPYPCAYCEKKFRRRQEMLVHVTTHTGEKNYSCDVCSRRFRVKNEVKRHKVTHSDEKPYVCATCGLNFRQKRYLNNHVKSKHSQRSND